MSRTTRPDDQTAPAASRSVAPTEEPLLSVKDLTVELPTEHGRVRIIEDVGFDLQRGEIAGLVGESGSGKTMTARAIMGLVPSKGSRLMGSVRLDGRELIGLSPQALSDIRGRDIGMIFQEPVRSLNPAFTVGDQIAEVVRRHRNASRAEAWDRAVAMLDMVGIPQATRRAKEYPHTFSGGMCQRVMLAIALACEPKVLVADEPTTALDVTVQAQVLRLIRSLQERTGISVLLITHDLGVVAEVCERTMVMYGGQIVETATTEAMFARPRHPYTAGLLASVLDILRAEDRPFASIPGSVAMPHEYPSGCRFHPRCEFAEHGRCDEQSPALVAIGAERRVRCVRVDELTLRGVADDD
jgi:peptide/nickel transport system ATP-binding protein/oligopeptide transport system ATP-binding protein